MIYLLTFTGTIKFLSDTKQNKKDLLGKKYCSAN